MLGLSNWTDRFCNGLIMCVRACVYVCVCYEGQAGRQAVSVQINSLRVGKLRKDNCFTEIVDATEIIVAYRSC